MGFLKAIGTCLGLLGTDSSFSANLKAETQNQTSCTAQESFQLLQLWPEASTLSDQPPQLSSPDQSKHLQFKETSTPLLSSSVPEPPPSASPVPEPESEPFSAASSSDMPETHP